MYFVNSSDDDIEVSLQGQPELLATDPESTPALRFFRTRSRFFFSAVCMFFTNVIGQLQTLPNCGCSDGFRNLEQESGSGNFQVRIQKFWAGAESSVSENVNPVTSGTNAIVKISFSTAPKRRQKRRKR